MLYDHSRTPNIIRLKVNVTIKRTIGRSNKSYLNIKQKELYCQIKRLSVIYPNGICIYIEKSKINSYLNCYCIFLALLT
jgi:hypothetical protein